MEIERGLEQGRRQDDVEDEIVRQRKPRLDAKQCQSPPAGDVFLAGAIVRNRPVTIGHCRDGT